MVNRHHAYRLLQCLTAAIRPLRVEELAEILAMDFDNTRDGLPQLKEDWRWKDRKEAVLSTCSSLIAVVKSGSHHVVQFSHFSVKEFLTSDRLAASRPEVSHFHILPGPAHTVIVKACLGILLRLDNGMSNVKAYSSALDGYAAVHWVDHARFENVSMHIVDGVRRLFDPAHPYFDAWHDQYDPDRQWYTFTGFGPKPRGSPLYYASFCGLRDLAAHLVAKYPTHVNAKLGQCLSPLVAALCNRHFDIAELLYQYGADVDIMGHSQWTPLHAALVDGYVDIAEWLLTHGADAMSPLDGHRTPLHYVATTGKIHSVQVLLRHRATMLVNARDLSHNTPLHLALWSHVSDKPTLDLLAHIADVKQQRGTPNIQFVQLLLEHGADVNAQNNDYSTPLHLATSPSGVGNPEIMKLLLEHGANVNAVDGTQSTPLHLASSRTFSQCLERVRVLIEHGADINAQDHVHWTSLHLASSLGKTKIMQILLENGADVNAKSWHHKTPLHLVMYLNSGAEAARLLIKHGADVNAQDTDHKTPLHLASSNGGEETVKLLIEEGADVNSHDKGCSTPLHLAVSASHGNIGVVRLLLSHGANGDERDDSGQTPFEIASSNGLSEVAKMLSDHVGPSIRDE